MLVLRLELHGLVMPWLIALTLALLMSACSPQPDRHPNGGISLTTNFPYSVVDDTTISAEGQNIALIEGFDQMYWVDDYLYFVRQISSNNFIEYSVQSDRIRNRFGRVIFDGTSVYVLAQTPLESFVGALGSGPRFSIEPIADGDSVIVSLPGGARITLRDSAGFTRRSLR